MNIYNDTCLTGNINYKTAKQQQHWQHVKLASFFLANTKSAAYRYQLDKDPAHDIYVKGSPANLSQGLIDVAGSIGGYIAGKGIMRNLMPRDTHPTLNSLGGSVAGISAGIGMKALLNKIRERRRVKDLEKYLANNGYTPE